jgi:hypothetical protein
LSSITPLQSVLEEEKKVFSNINIIESDVMYRSGSDVMYRLLAIYVFECFINDVKKTTGDDDMQVRDSWLVEELRKT